MGLNKLTIISLIVIIVLLYFPQTHVNYLRAVNESQVLWRKYVSVAMEDAIYTMKHSSTAYGANAEQINRYNITLTLESFFSSLAHTLGQADTSELSRLYTKIPVIIIYEPLGYRVNCNYSVNSDEKEISFRANMPLEPYIVEDSKSIYYLSHGIHLRIQSKGKYGDTTHLTENGMIEGEIQEVLQIILGDEQLKEEYPLLASVSSSEELKALFYSNIQAQVAELFEGIETDYHEAALSELSTTIDFEKFQFAGITALVTFEGYKNNEVYLKPIHSFNDIKPKKLCYGFSDEDSSVYCWQTDCSEHADQEPIAVFTSIKEAAQHNFKPCPISILRFE